MQQNTLPIWDLSDLYLGFEDPNIQKDVSLMDKIRSDLFLLIPQLKTTPLNIDSWSKAFDLYNQHLELGHKIINYARLRTDEDTSNQESQAFMQRMQQQISKAESQLTFFPLLVSELDTENVKSLLHDPRSNKYNEYIRNARRLKPHMLTESEEKLLVLTMQQEREAWAMFENQLSTRLPYGTTQIDGQEQILTASLINTLLEHPNTEIRAEAYNRRCQAFQAEHESLSFAYQQQVRNVITEKDLRSYKNILESVSDNHDIAITAIPNLIEKVEKNKFIFQKFFKWKAGLLNQKTLKASDISAPLPNSTDQKIPWDEAVELTLNAYNKLGSTFKDITNQFFTNSWIHASPDKRKYTGAYCMYADQHPYLLVNYQGNLTDVSTLAHEIGHGVNGLLFREQKLLQRHPGLILAETASQFGELLLIEELKNKDSKTYLNALHNFITHSMNAIFQQTLITQFEFEAFKQTETKGLSPNWLCEKWLELKKNLGSDSIDYPEQEKWTWARISHIFFHPFYCFSYSMSLLLVLALAKQYNNVDKDDFAVRFKQLLTIGGSISAQELLQKTMGYDLDKCDFIDDGFEYFEQLVDQCINSV